MTLSTCAQNEVRDYNAQMEHKVDLLMQILQNSASPGPSLSLQGLTQVLVKWPTASPLPLSS